MCEAGWEVEGGGPGVPACTEDVPFKCVVCRYMRAVDIQLAPDEAHVGAEIRVIGNDSGEKVRGPWLLLVVFSACVRDGACAYVWGKWVSLMLMVLVCTYIPGFGTHMAGI
jgi:hypothetical protein